MKNLLLATFCALAFVPTACDYSKDPDPNWGPEAGSSPTLDAGQSSGDDVVDDNATDASTSVDIDEGDPLPDLELDDPSVDDVTLIELAGDHITVTGDGAAVDGTTVTIVAGGTYRLEGTLDDGGVVVDSADDEVVHLVLAGVEIHSSTTAPLYVAQAETTHVVLEAGSENRLTDGSAYVFASAEETEPNAALFSKDDLVISGDGRLEVMGNYNDGIASKDELRIAGGVIVVDAVDDGVRGKELLGVEEGALSVRAGGDGLKADADVESEDEDGLGVIRIEGGDLDVVAGLDGLDAAGDVVVTGGTLVVEAGSGTAPLAADASAKAIKGTVSVVIAGGTVTATASDDAVHSNGDILLSDGSLTVASDDDGVHADDSVTITGGTLDVQRSYEGIEAAIVTIEGGELHIVASDDGINVAGGADGSGDMWPIAGGHGGPGGGGGEVVGDYYLYIRGGWIVIDADGDGLDSNGIIEFTGGVALVNGPTGNGNGALDCNGTFTMDGGFLIATGSAGMPEVPGDSTSAQNSVLVTLTSSQAADTLVHVEDSAGNEVFTFRPSKAYQSVAFSTPDLAQGTSYSVYVGGTTTGTEVDGLVDGGVYSAGTEAATFTIDSATTTVGSSGGWGPGW